MSFLIPAGLGLLGSFLTGKAQSNQSNKQNTYQVDQARREYEAQQMMDQERDQRNLDGIDFLGAVASAKGYNLPPGAIDALKARGVFKGMPSSQRFLDAPKQSTGNLVMGVLGGALSKYGGATGAAAMDRALTSNRLLGGITGNELGGAAGGASGAIGGVGGASGAAGGLAGAGSAAGGAGDDILSYYQGLLNMGGGGR